jgi:DNA methylase
MSTTSLLTEADLIRTIREGTYTLPELYGQCEARADISRDGGLEPPDAEHPTDRVWRRRLRGALQTRRLAGEAERISRSVWVIRGTRQHPRTLVLVAPGPTLANIELHLSNAVDLLHGLDGPADLVLCDPPYGLLRGTPDSSAGRLYKRDRSKVVPGYVDVEGSAYGEFTRRWVAAAASALRCGGQLAAITGPQRAAVVQCAAEESGLEWVCSIAAFRHFALRTTRRPACSHWTITVMCRGRAQDSRRVFNTPPDLPRARSGRDYPLDWWPENGRSDRPGVLRYDNGLPRLLVRRVIQAHTNPGEVVVDPCIGGGTSAIEALALGRRFVGGDVNPNALRFAAARLLTEHAWSEESTSPCDLSIKRRREALSQDTAQESPVAAEQNERLVIELALGVMQGKGWVEEPDDELIQTLRRLYHDNPVCQQEVKFTGEMLHDMCAARPGEYLAAAFENECQERWEREEAERWSCPCGYTFGLYSWSPTKADFYTLTTDGLFDSGVTKCPSCARNLAKVRAEHADGQLGFAF